MTNLNPNLDEYLDLMIETATNDIGFKRWSDLKRNIDNRIDRGQMYVTPSEAKGIRYNSRKNKAIRLYNMPVELAVMVSHALDDKPETISFPDPEPIQPHELEAIAVGLECGTISAQQVREVLEMPSIDEDDIKKPTPLDHSLWDIKVKQSTVALNEAATDLMVFCRQWAQALRDKK
ncbi:hypothetical protein [Gluconacetobacter tumulicola]|uniref:Uncharacterized protein n=2 Tax=Gluconacetobacter tumulicola TaxID=1017177 RepID=A0A7W4JCH0_9PROT|nr:hypothetical protein [Gluconacetobacter tumulicola]